MINMYNQQIRELDIETLVRAMMQFYHCNTNDAYEKLEQYILDLVKDNPQTRYILDLRNSNVGDYDLAVCISHILCQGEKDRILLELSSHRDSELLEGVLIKLLNQPRIVTTSREVEPSIIMDISDINN